MWFWMDGSHGVSSHVGVAMVTKTQMFMVSILVVVFLVVDERFECEVSWFILVCGAVK